MIDQMPDRIKQIMDDKAMSQQEFAAALDMSPASLSNIFTGRSKPTNNHTIAIHRSFPEINIDWLLFGEGPMKLSTDVDVLAVTTDTPLFSTVAPQSSLDRDNQTLSPGEVYQPLTNASPIPPIVDADKIVEKVKYIDKPMRKIKEIRVFYDDGTYESFSS